MGKSKVTANFALEADQQAWLESMAGQYNLPDASKALRVLLDYAIEDADPDHIFGTVRCRHCG